MRQLIIARKDLNMSPGKLAAQVSHGSIAFLSWFIRNNVDLDGHVDGYIDDDHAEPCSEWEIILNTMKKYA